MAGRVWGVRGAWVSGGGGGYRGRSACGPQEVVRSPDGRYRLFGIGDAVASRNVHAAIYDALRLCKDL